MIEPRTTNLLQQVAIYPLPVYNCCFLIPGPSNGWFFRRWMLMVACSLEVGMSKVTADCVNRNLSKNWSLDLSLKFRLAVLSVNIKRELRMGWWIGLFKLRTEMMNSLSRIWSFTCRDILTGKHFILVSQGLFSFKLKANLKLNFGQTGRVVIFFNCGWSQHLSKANLENVNRKICSGKLTFSLVFNQFHLLHLNSHAGAYLKSLVVDSSDPAKYFNLPPTSGCSLKPE